MFGAGIVLLRISNRKAGLDLKFPQVATRLSGLWSGLKGKKFLERSTESCTPGQGAPV